MTYINRPALLPTNYDDLRMKLWQAQRAFPHCRPGQALVNAFGMPAELEGNIYESTAAWDVYGRVIDYCMANAIEMKGL